MLYQFPDSTIAYSQLSSVEFTFLGSPFIFSPFNLLNAFVSFVIFDCALVDVPIMRRPLSILALVLTA